MITLYAKRFMQYIEFFRAQNHLLALDENHSNYSKIKERVELLKQHIDSCPEGISPKQDEDLRYEALRRVNDRSEVMEVTIDP